MPRLLRQVMEEVLDRWRDDVAAEWRDLFGGVCLGFSDMTAELELEAWEPVFPTRKGKQFPGAPVGAHMLKAFDGVAPSAVRAIVLGQDPYPEPASATGRAFEIGAAMEWRDLDRMFSASVRAYTQSVLAARLARLDLARSFAQWPEVLRELETGKIPTEGHRAISDTHERQGVLLLNASLTLTRFRRDIDPHQSEGHLPIWRPLMLTVLRATVSMGRPVAFLGFGDAASALFAEAGLAHHDQAVVVERPHPAFANEYLERCNPFTQANDGLLERGAEPIGW